LAQVADRLALADYQVGVAGRAAQEQDVDQMVGFPALVSVRMRAKSICRI
jgi:hypothetical protein